VRYAKPGDSTSTVLGELNKTIRTMSQLARAQSMAALNLDRPHPEADGDVAAAAGTHHLLKETIHETDRPWKSNRRDKDDDSERFSI
jgi:uncharacterized protein YjcR